MKDLHFYVSFQFADQEIYVEMPRYPFLQNKTYMYSFINSLETAKTADTL